MFACYCVVNDFKELAAAGKANLLIDIRREFGQIFEDNVQFVEFLVFTGSHQLLKAWHDITRQLERRQYMMTMSTLSNGKNGSVIIADIALLVYQALKLS